MQKNEMETNEGVTAGVNYFAKYIKTTNPVLLSIINKSSKMHGEKTKKRIKDILVNIIKKEKEKLKKVCFEGLPDDLPLLRSLIWKINLKYLPMDVDRWAETLKKKQSEYQDIKSAFMLKMEAERKLYQELDEITAANNHELLNTFRKNKEKELNTFIKYTDRQLLEEIDKDVRRTHTDLNFFFMPSKTEDFTKLTNDEIRGIVEKRRSTDVKTIDDIYINIEVNKFETHADVLCRILYIFAKLNPDIQYVQGMNEILAPIYYCFSFDASCPQSSSDLEADTFWAFSFLMDDIKTLFMRNKDDSKEGIFKKIEKLKDLIKVVDKDIYNILFKHSVELSHFAFRWIILLFTQEFILPDVMRLWDAIFSDKDRFYYVFYISLAILKLKKSKIMSSDFAGIIIELQNLEDIEAEDILEEVSLLKKGFDKKLKQMMNEKAKDVKV